MVLCISAVPDGAFLGKCSDLKDRSWSRILLVMCRLLDISVETGFT